MGTGYANLRGKGKKEKLAEEGGTQRGRIQLEPSGTSSLFLALPGIPVTKPMVYLCDNQMLLKVVKSWADEGRDECRPSNRRVPKKKNSRSSNISGQSESALRRTCK